MFKAQLSKQDYLDYCRVSAAPLTEECEQLLAQARTEQVVTVLFWSVAFAAIVFAAWVIIKALKRRRSGKAEQ